MCVCLFVRASEHVLRRPKWMALLRYFNIPYIYCTRARARTFARSQQGAVGSRSRRRLFRILTASILFLDEREAVNKLGEKDRDRAVRFLESRGWRLGHYCRPLHCEEHRDRDGRQENEQNTIHILSIHV